LETLKFSFDLQLNPHQFTAAAEFLKDYPGIPVIINHLGSPTLADLTDEKLQKQYWDGLSALASLPHASIKISMLCYADKNWDQNAAVTGS
jgi:predicted TIM-barrel fold metal-dependent hydrolase